MTLSTQVFAGCGMKDISDEWMGVSKWRSERCFQCLQIGKDWLRKIEMDSAFERVAAMNENTELSR